MLQFSLVFMLQERGPRQKTCLMTDIITFGLGNSTILNQDGKTKILSYVACFYSKCLAKIVFWRAASWLKRSGTSRGKLWSCCSGELFSLSSRLCFGGKRFDWANVNFGRLLNIFYTERSWHAYWFSLVGMICPLMQEHFLSWPL